MTETVGWQVCVRRGPKAMSGEAKHSKALGVGAEASGSVGAGHRDLGKATACRDQPGWVGKQPEGENLGDDALNPGFVAPPETGVG